jgi:hypothetical protein
MSSRLSVSEAVCMYEYCGKNIMPLILSRMFCRLLTNLAFKLSFSTSQIVLAIKQVSVLVVCRSSDVGSEF